MSKILDILQAVLQVAKIIGCIIWSCLVFFVRLCFKSARPKPDFSCDIVLITGAAQGLGKELAIQFSKCGATLVLWDINETKLHQTCSEITSQGKDAFAYVVDCSDKKQIYETADKVREEIGNVSVLVNNAGILVTKNIMDMTDEQVEATFKVNTFAHFWTVRAFLPWMIENNYGYIINILSLASLNGFRTMSAYCASKAAGFSFSESLRMELRELKKNGISVTAICPAFMNTQMIASLSGIGLPLQPKDVAIATLAAAYDRQFLVPVPSHFKFACILKFIFPTKVVDEIDTLMGFDEIKFKSS